MTETNPSTLVVLIVQALMALSFICGGGLFLVKLGDVMGTFKQASKQHADSITKIETKIENLSVVLTTVAVQKSEMDSLRAEQTTLRSDLARAQDTISELRHYRGFIIDDLQRGAREFGSSGSK